MKPKTKLQIQVYDLSRKIPKVTDIQKQWAYDKLFHFYARKTAHTATCFECGHTWKVETNLISAISGVDCPNCKKNLKVKKTQHWHTSEADSFQIITTFEGFQVIRVFEIHHFCSKGEPAVYNCYEIYQHWLSVKGKNVIVGHTGGASGWGGCQSWHGGFEVRDNHSSKYYHSKLNTYPKKRFIQILKRNGFKGSFHGIDPFSFIQLLIREPKFETLLKAGQYKLLDEFTGRNDYITQYWDQIKICLRNNYVIPNFREWHDHIRLLQYFKLDDHSTKYICPDNFIQEHRRLINKKQVIIDKQNKEERARQAISAEKAYQAIRKKYLDIIITDGEINIKVLPNIMAFYDEGKALHHCVYSSSYYEDPDSLIMSARKGDQRLETIQLSLKSMEIQQSRGLQNNDSEFHKRIVDLVNNNIDVIKNERNLRKEHKAKTAA